MMEKEPGIEKSIKEKVKLKYSLFDITSSYYCILGCAHCMYDCKPENPQNTICSDNILKLLDEAIGLDCFSSFSFGEQEIFYNLPLFIELAKYLKSNKSNSSLSITTSSYWVKDYNHALEQFQSLKELGLKDVLLSIDDFHQKKVSIEKVANSIKACLSLGLNISLQTIVSKTSHRKSYYLNALKGIMNSNFDISKIDWVEHNFTPVGRAKNIPEDELIFESKHLIGGCSAMEVVQITPNGDVIPCCGSGACAKYLSIGNINKNSLKEIMGMADLNPLLNSLFVWIGPYGIMKELSESEKNKFLSKQHTGVCHACYEIFSNKELVNLLRNRMDAKKINLLAARWHLEKCYSIKKNN